MLGDHAPDQLQPAHDPRPCGGGQPPGGVPVCGLHLPGHGRAPQVRPGVSRVPDRDPAVHGCGVHHVLREQAEAELQPPLQGAGVGGAARFLCVLRRHGYQPVEGSAALQLLRLVGPLRAGVWLLRHSRGGHGGQEPLRHGAAPAQRPRPLPGARGTLLQRGAALPAPHQHPRGGHQRVLVRAAARAAPAQRHLQLVAY